MQKERRRGSCARPGGRRRGAVATKCQLNALTGCVLASPELHCASRLTLRRSTHPAKFDLAPVASAPPSVRKLSSIGPRFAEGRRVAAADGSTSSACDRLDKPSAHVAIDFSSA